MGRAIGGGDRPSADKPVSQWWSDLPTERVPVCALKSADSPRAAGERESHVRLIVASTDRLPPIIVHRSTMRVIDGMHRLRASILRNEEDIEVRFFEGTPEEAFVVAVAANTSHGMPLTLADRKAAATRILKYFPTWSDRRVASATGLSHRTIAAVRRCATGDSVQSNGRLGKDGRLHPLSSAKGRQIAADLIHHDPGVSLREIARKAGVSPATVRDVRVRLERGDAPLPSATSVEPDSPGGAPDEGEPETETAAPSVMKPDNPLRIRNLLVQLRDNPAVRHSESGRAMLRLLAVGAAGPRDCERFAHEVPGFCHTQIVELAQLIGGAWSALADGLNASLDTPASDNWGNELL